MAKTLLQETLILIAESGLSTAQIEAGTGLKTRWLNTVISGATADPGVNKIEKLNAWLRRQSGKAA